jgi:hypothetical protein
MLYYYAQYPRYMRTVAAKMVISSAWSWSWKDGPCNESHSGT